MGSPQQQWFTDVQPIPAEQSFTDVQPIEKSTASEQGAWTGAIRGLKNLVAMPGQLYSALADDPKTDEEKMIHENGIITPHGHLPGALALPIWRVIGKPMADAEDKGKQYEQMAASEKDPAIKKQLLDAAGAWKMGATVPLVGPVAANLAERAAYGEQGPSAVDTEGRSGFANRNADISGALAEGTAYALAPKAAEETAGAAGTVLGKGTGFVKNLTPKQAGQVVGGTTGAVAGHGPLSVPGAYYGAKGAGAMVESILGKERANTPLFAPKLNPSLVSEARTLPGQIPPETFAQPTPTAAAASIPPRAGLSLPSAPVGAELAELPATGARPAAQTGEALANLPPRAVHQAIQELGMKATIPEITQRAQTIAAAEYPPAHPDIAVQKVKPSSADILDDKAVAEKIRNAASAEDKMRLREIYGQNRLGSDVSTQKGRLTGVMGEGNDIYVRDRSADATPSGTALPKEIRTPADAMRQVQLMKDAGASIEAVKDFQRRASVKFGPDWQLHSSDDLTPEWQKALDDLKAKKSRPIAGTD